MKETIRQKGYAAGTWCEIPSAYSAGAIASAGMDFVIIDMEHGPAGFETAQNMTYAAQAEGRSAFIRVPKLDESFILRALDTGADGIVVPHVESTDDLERIAKYAKFPPSGERGFNPFIRAGGYGNAGKDFFEKQNSKAMIAVILEGIAAFENIEKLAADKTADIYYIGQYDLSSALGCPGDIKNEKVTAMLKKAVEAVNKHGKTAGCMVHSLSDAKAMLALGVKFIVYSVDTGILTRTYKEFADGLGGK